MPEPVPRKPKAGHPARRHPAGERIRDKPQGPRLPGALAANPPGGDGRFSTRVASVE